MSLVLSCVLSTHNKRILYCNLSFKYSGRWRRQLTPSFRLTMPVSSEAAKGEAVEGTWYQNKNLYRWRIKIDLSPLNAECTVILLKAALNLMTDWLGIYSYASLLSSVQWFKYWHCHSGSRLLINTSLSRSYFLPYDLDVIVTIIYIARLSLSIHGWVKLHTKVTIIYIQTQIYAVLPTAITHCHTVIVRAFHNVRSPNTGI